MLQYIYDSLPLVCCWIVIAPHRRRGRYFIFERRMYFSIVIYFCLFVITGQRGRLQNPHIQTLGLPLKFGTRKFASHTLPFKLFDIQLQHHSIIVKNLIGVHSCITAQRSANKFECSRSSAVFIVQKYFLR